MELHVRGRAGCCKTKVVVRRDVKNGRLEVGPGKVEFAREPAATVTAHIPGKRTKSVIDVVFLSPHLSGQEIMLSLIDIYGEVAILACDRGAFQPLLANHNPMRSADHLHRVQDQNDGIRKAQWGELIPKHRKVDRRISRSAWYLLTFLLNLDPNGFAEGRRPSGIGHPQDWIFRDRGIDGSTDR